MVALYEAGARAAVVYVWPHPHSMICQNVAVADGRLMILLLDDPDDVS